MASPKRISLQEIPAPASYAAENALLGLLISNPVYMADARKVIAEDSFADPENGKIWSWLTERDDAGDEVTEISAFSELNSRHFIDNITRCFNGSAGVSEAHTAINAVANAAICRRAYNAGFEMMTTASQGQADAALGASRKFNDDTEAMLRDTETRRLDDAINDFAEVLTARQNAVRRGESLRVTTSFDTLDFYTYGGFARGNLVVMAARPSVGKTAVMLQMVRAASLAGSHVMVFSLEMTNAELIQRMIRSNSDMTGHQLAQGQVDWQKFEVSTGQFSDLPIWLNDRAVYFDDICTKILTAHRRGQCDAVYIDYLGLISYREKAVSVYAQVSEATRRLKQLAKACNVPIVLLCQLNRDMSKEGRAPQLHDLRDSGSIEQDADIVLMLERQISADADTSRQLNLYIRKNRQGEAGHCLHLWFDESFSNLSEVGKDGTIYANLKADAQ